VVRQVHAFLAWAFVASVVVQVFLAGLAIPQLGGNGSFVTHRDFGYLIGLLTLLLLVAAVVARAGRRRIGQAAGLLVLYVVQSSLPYMDPGLPFAAALHPVNALVMFWLGVVYARQVWRERAAAAAEATPAV
jgi:fucose 4-O-acetylase-like acetyltransferase